MGYIIGAVVILLIVGLVIKIKYTTSHHFLLLYKIACKPRIYII